MSVQTTATRASSEFRQERKRESNRCACLRGRPGARLVKKEPATATWRRQKKTRGEPRLESLVESLVERRLTLLGVTKDSDESKPFVCGRRLFGVLALARTR
jgi:hypothetical protein